ncbi:MAG TPA: cytochrome c family protein [Alphaproteobacteria bacterium]|nr:cytochrome c family protein [Alphaproteobacteria bacterium]
MKVSKFGRRAFALAVMFSGAIAGQALALEPGDAAAGAKVFKKCQACHSIVAADGNKIGPNLHGVIGRKAGTQEGFNYSDAMKASGIVWDEASIEKYLRDPKGFIPKNKMAFVGLKKDSDLANVLAFIKAESGK